MLPAPVTLTAAAARRFQLRTLGLDTPHASVGAAIAHHGFVQIDPINICGRMQDHILRNRVAGYREGDLLRHLHGQADAPLAPAERTAFEHHLPSTALLVALEREAWPHLRAAMEARTRRAGAWSGRLTPRERELVPRIFAVIDEQGPIRSDAIKDDRRATQVWGSATLVKSTLQKLFFHGRLLIAGRDAAGRRRYDRPERVLPATVLETPPPTAAESLRWEVHLRLRQRRLVTLRRAELPAVADLVQPVKVEGLPLLYTLREDRDQLEAAHPEPPHQPNEPVRLLAPLDPLIYDRRLTAALWDFPYTWEVYTPPAKRRRGYYALPALAGDELVGHVDPRADREARRLRIENRQLRRGYRATEAIRALAAFLGLR